MDEPYLLIDTCTYADDDERSNLPWGVDDDRTIGEILDANTMKS